jgi:hypothetical protein
MSMSHLLKRLEKRLKAHVERDQLEEILDVVIQDSPWQQMNDPRYYKFTHRDLHNMHQWTVTKMNEPGFFS